MNTFEYIEAQLDSRVRPYIQAHGGSVKLVEFRDGVAKVEFQSACACCELQPVTFAARVRPALKEIDGVDEVRCLSISYGNRKLDSIAKFFSEDKA